MPASKIKLLNFYLWKNRIILPDDRIVSRTCFGITKNLDDRQNGYEGHVGHAIQFAATWVGPDRVIRSLEHKIKATFDASCVVGHRNFKYEWIDETIPFDQILGWVEWELQDHPLVSKHIILQD
jgi:hypothetical protein